MNRVVLVVPVGRDYRLLPRCLEHYRSLGVDRILLNVHARSDWGVDLVDRIQEIAREYDALIGHVHCEVYVESYRTTRVIVDHYTGSGDWVLYSDVDEFQEYPDTLRNVIAYCEVNGYDHVRGFLLDRVAPDGSLPMLNDRPLHELFPVGAQITSVIREGCADKVVLANSRLPVGAGQHFVKRGNCVPIQDLKVTVHHYRWDSEAPANLAYMKHMLDAIGANWGVEHGRVLTHLEENDQRFDLSDPALMVHYPGAPAEVGREAGLPAREWEITGDSVPVQYEADELAKEDDGSYSLVRHGGTISRLNTSAAIIWTLCDGQRSVKEIASDLKLEYEDSEKDIEDDVLSTIKVLACQHLLRVSSPSNHLTGGLWSASRQTEFLRNLSWFSEPELYRDVDLCHGMLAHIRDTEYEGENTFHFYWRSVKVPFADKQIASLMSCLATQDLDRSKVILWYADSDVPDHPELERLIEGGHVEARKYDPGLLAVNTPLEGRDDLLFLKDDMCYLDGDLFRLLVLFRFGGVYVDMDVLLLRDFSPLLGFEFMYAWGSSEPGLINGAVMRFFPGSAALYAMMMVLRDSNPAAESTSWGAGSYGRVRDRYPFTVLPYAFFNPEWVWFDDKRHEYAENPGTFMSFNPSSRNIYRHAFAWHWHNKWDQEVESNSKFDLLANMLHRSWHDKKRFLGYRWRV